MQDLPHPLPSRVADLAAEFASSLPARLANMRNALKRGDVPTVQREAHTLRGSAASFGYPRVGASAAQLEQSCIDADPSRILAAFDTLYTCALADAPHAFTKE